jgi:antitoxin VapB
MGHTAKLFSNGKSQAVRLPKAYRFEGSEVNIRRDESTGEVILSSKPTTLADFFAFADRLNAEIPDDFLSDEQRKTLPQDRNPFADWIE